PDDAEFLCAGTMIRLQREHGFEAHIATMTPGDCGSAEQGSTEISRIRRAEGAAAVQLIGGHYHCLEERDLLTFDVRQLDKFPKASEEYLADNFSFRTPFINWSKQIKFRLFKVSPNPDHLIIGRNGRYFIADDEKRIYEGDLNFTPEQLAIFEQEWLRRKHYFDSLGIPVYVLPGPSALEIYPEDLPFSIQRKYTFNRIDQLEGKFRKRLPKLLVNPVPTLVDGKKHGNMYYILDNHWTEKAGYYVSKMLLKRMKHEHFPQLDLTFLDRYTWSKIPRNFGHFVALIGVSGLEEVTEIRSGYIDQAEDAPDFAFTYTSEGVSVEDQQLHFVNKQAKNKLKILVIRDSFGGALVPFIKETFAESVFIFDSWNYRLNKSILASYKPDVVLYVTYDPSLHNQINPENWEW
ncbi:MAG: PIG-L family deacetylase, partial [Flavobacteriia bacterium]|nr:PIG-L family deacetylase [Flavobacteriia bacterium]